MIDILNTIFKDDYNLEEVKKHNNRLYDFVNRNSNTLFVTIGDSWTYGYRLDEELYTDDLIAKNNYRINHTYGNIISDYFKYDYLNLCVPAINNIWMLKKYKQLKDIQHKLPYNNVLYFITLTEYGREIYTDFDWDEELHSYYYPQANTAKELAINLSEYISKQFLMYNDENLHLGINYVDNLYSDELKHNMLKQSWLEIILNKKIIDECIVVGSWVIPKYENLLKINTNVSKFQLLSELNQMVIQADNRINLLYNSGLNHKSGYAHPRSQAHLLWGNYIIKNIK